MTATTPHGNRRRPARAAALRVAAALCALAAAAAVAACGSSSGSPSSSPSASFAQNAVKFSKCMREHGIPNFPDPEVTGNSVRLRLKAGPGTANPQTMEAAQRACRRYSPAEQEKLTPAQKAEREEAGLKFAKCMREHGIDVPNPTTAGGGFKIQLGKPGAGGPNPESPAFQAAQKACQGLLPKPRGAGGLSTGGAKGGGGGPGLALSAGG